MIIKYFGELGTLLFRMIMISFTIPPNVLTFYIVYVGIYENRWPSELDMAFLFVTTSVITVYMIAACRFSIFKRSKRGLMH